MAENITNKVKRPISLLVLIITLLATFIFYYIDDFGNRGYNEHLLLVIMILSTIVTIIFITNDKSPKILSNISFKISYLFLIGYFIVFFQRYIDLLLGYFSPNDTFLWSNSYTINRSALITLCGYTSFVLGYLYYRPKYKLISYSAQCHPTPINVFPLKIISLCCVALFFYYNGADYIAGTYSQEYIESKRGTMAAYSEVLTLSFFIIIFSLEIYNNNYSSLKQYIRGLGIVFHISLILYLGLVLISGDRGPIIQVLLMWFSSYYIICRPKINITTLLILIIIGAYFVNALGIARGKDHTRSFGSRLQEALIEKRVNDYRASFFPPTAELSNSVRCLHYAVDYVPENHPFLYGSFQVRDILSGIPFSSKVTEIILNQKFQYKNSAYFITYIRNGQFYTSGEGSSIIADLYLAFGIWSVLAGMFAWGILIKYVECRIFTDSRVKKLAIIILTITLYTGSISVNRASMFGLISLFSFSIIIAWLYLHVIKKIKIQFF